MKKTTAILIVMVFVFCIDSPLAFGNETMDAIYLPVGTLTLAAPRGITPRRTPVAFPHSLHFDTSCKTCHHKWDGVAPVRDCMASGCHDGIVFNKDAKSKADEMRYYKTAYHKNCISCHQRLATEKQKLESSKIVLTKPVPKAGPTGCKECHPKD